MINSIRFQAYYRIKTDTFKGPGLQTRVEQELENQKVPVHTEFRFFGYPGYGEPVDSEVDVWTEQDADSRLKERETLIQGIEEGRIEPDRGTNGMRYAPRPNKPSIVFDHNAESDFTQEYFKEFQPGCYTHDQEPLFDFVTGQRFDDAKVASIRAQVQASIDSRHKRHKPADSEQGA